MVLSSCLRGNDTPPPTRRSMTVLGILGGSGVYDMAGLKNAEWRRGRLAVRRDVRRVPVRRAGRARRRLRARHGRGHRHSPTSINYRANIDALKRSASPTSCRCRPAARCARTCRRAISSWSTSSSTAPSPARRASSARAWSPMLDGAADLQPPGRGRVRLRAEGRLPDQDGRHLHRDGGPAILQPRRIEALPQLGLRRDRHDQHAGGQLARRRRFAT